MKCRAYDAAASAVRVHFSVASFCLADRERAPRKERFTDSSSGNVETSRKPLGRSLGRFREQPGTPVV